jgi:hypothetical protein
LNVGVVILVAESNADSFVAVTVAAKLNHSFAVAFFGAELASVVRDDKPVFLEFVDGVLYFHYAINLTQPLVFVKGKIYFFFIFFWPL